MAVFERHDWPSEREFTTITNVRCFHRSWQIEFGSSEKWVRTSDCCSEVCCVGVLWLCLHGTLLASAASLQVSQQQSRPFLECSWGCVVDENDQKRHRASSPALTHAEIRGLHPHASCTSCFPQLGDSVSDTRIHVRTKEWRQSALPETPATVMSRSVVFHPSQRELLVIRDRSEGATRSTGEAEKRAND
ncbi:hypothetical protein BLNAU_14576 [Blattamonas nauphoetae]|uniref:Uncharacterized protein n=1 Tax=Blattamonas nauphoetae TaxID=2049346 RepID=A0ABQ9XD79_9EUKA|nr:hypothetical protein BLNAU_14576 [Blattamonas nauphoetae]